MSNHNKKTIAIDFDGVIHKYSKGWHDGTCYDEPMEGAFKAIEKLMKEHIVYIHTTRDPGSVADWFEKYSVPFSVMTNPMGMGYPFLNDDIDVIGTNVVYVTNKKFAALAYIDDRGIRFTDWDTILKEKLWRE